MSFKLFDADNSGFLSPAEVGKMFVLIERGRLQMEANSKTKSGVAPRVEVSTEDIMRIKSLVKKIFELVDTNNDGQLSLTEFSDGFATYPEICAYFMQY